MPDYEHSNNYHKIALKIKEINNLKDLESLKRKLGELEQDSEVRELISKCDDRAREIKDLINEEKYQKAVSEFSTLNAQLDLDSLSNESEAFNYKDFNALLAQFEAIKTYKDSSNYIDSLNKEKEYVSLISLYNSGNCNWEEISDRFKALGNYKKSHEYYEACRPAVEEQRKERELQEKKKIEEENEAKYEEACKLMKNGNLQYASMRFKDLGDYKDSKQQAEECDKRRAAIATAKRKKELTALFIYWAIMFAGIVAYLIYCLVSYNADDNGHWHSILGNEFNYSYHDDSLIAEVPPTCNDEGYIEYECTTCKLIHRVIIPAIGHTSDSGKVTKEPTCTEKGIKTYTCTTCGAVVKTESIAAKEHTSDSGIVTKEPTCTEKGTKTYTCTTCGAVVKTESIDMKPHSYIDSIKVQPQCETRGLAESTCSVCGYTTTRTLDAIGHDWTLVSRVNPTCTAEGSETYSCNTCKKTKVEVIQATGHNWIKVKEVAPTCVSEGYVGYSCSVCNITRKEVIDAKGHNYLDGFCLDCGFDRNQYHVGDIGPAGGYIFYDCDADNDSGNKDGLKSSECGWRFLEAAPYDVGSTNYPWGDDVYKLGTDTAIGKGKSNTTIILLNASKTINPNAAIACNDYKCKEFDDWFLPSRDELNQMYVNLRKKGLGGFANDSYYWSSSECDNDPNGAWRQNGNGGFQYNYNRFNNSRVRPVRAF